MREWRSLAVYVVTAGGGKQVQEMLWASELFSTLEKRAEELRKIPAK